MFVCRGAGRLLAIQYLTRQDNRNVFPETRTELIQGKAASRRELASRSQGRERQVISQLSELDSISRRQVSASLSEMQELATIRPKARLSNSMCLPANEGQEEG